MYYANAPNDLYFWNDIRVNKLRVFGLGTRKNPKPEVRGRVRFDF